MLKLIIQFLKTEQFSHTMWGIGALLWIIVPYSWLVFADHFGIGFIWLWFWGILFGSFVFYFLKNKDESV